MCVYRQAGKAVSYNETMNTYVKLQLASIQMSFGNFEFLPLLELKYSLNLF